MTIVYRIDTRDRICFLGEGWDESAYAGGAPQLTRERVLGHSIFDFIAGSESKHVYRLLLGATRGSRRAFRFPFRCDSPEDRRFLTMTLRRYNGTGVEFVCTLERVEARTRIALLDAEIPRTDECLRMCSWCKRVDIGANNWEELDAAIETLDLFRSADLPQLTHGMCDRCHALVQTKCESNAP